jgi:pimeloyl-ACP methyl ester carboxylesterase
MNAYSERRLELNGVEIALYEAGQGQPLLFLHGAGTLTGFDSLLPLADHFRLIVPHHPGFGNSADDGAITSVHDYERHYLDLLDRLEIGDLTLVGHSMGGWIAATLAISQGPRISELVLAAPWGLNVPEHPTVDSFSIPDAEFPQYLSADLSVFAGKAPDPPTPEFLADRYREQTSAARVLWRHTYDPSLARWLHRVRAPTLLLWGALDRVIPVGQLPVWQGLLRNADELILPGVGHLLFDESERSTAAIVEHAQGRLARAGASAVS